MTRRLFLGNFALITLGWFFPKLSLRAANEEVLWVEEVFDFGRMPAIAGIIEHGDSCIRAAVITRQPFWYRLSENEKELIRNQMKTRVRRHLSTRSTFCRYGDELLTGFEEYIETF